jgi:hypothetical protein
MNETTKENVAEALESLAAEESWNGDLWQRCYDLVAANWENELLAFIHDDLIHYDGAFHSRNILGFRTKPDENLLDDYRYEFRSIAAALRANLPLDQAKKRFGL